MIDVSFGSLVCHAEAKWFPTLFEKHMYSTDFHLGMYYVFIIGKGVDTANDIVYLNFHCCGIYECSVQLGSRVAVSTEQ